MSSTLNQKLRFWKEVEARLRPMLAGNTACEKPLSDLDAGTWSRALVLNCLILQDCLPDGARLRADGSLKQWCFSIAKVDVAQVAKGLKEFQLFLRNYPNEWRFISIADFKRRLPYRFTGDYFSPVKDILESFLAAPVPDTFRVLNQWVTFPTKLTLQDAADDLTDQARIEYLENEVRLAHLDLGFPEVGELSQVFRSWFKNFHPYSNLQPHHSNGAVADRKGRSLVDKYSGMCADHRTQYLLKKCGIEPSSIGFEALEDTIPTARLITVPKGIDKRRAICPEPTAYQFCQQAIWEQLDSFITHSPLADHISIHDQGVNRDAAVKASKFCNAATIDLSSASDSVSWRLIKAVTSGVPELYGALWATRSTHVDLGAGHGIVATAKYAPMGSSLCFPMESVLFAAICEVAGSHVNARRPDYKVYGDDIIVEQALYEEVIRILGLCGFLVNEQKTFSPYCRYKESCGVEAFDGVDVSVLGISRKFSANSLTKHNPGLIDCYIGLANELYSRGWLGARMYVLSFIQTLPVRLLPAFSELPELGIRTPEATFWRHQRRWNADYQCFEVRIGCLTCRRDKRLDESHGHVALLETLRQYSRSNRDGLRNPSDRISVSISTPTLRWGSRWVPEWFFHAPVPDDFFVDSETLGVTLRVNTAVWMEN